MIQKSEAKQRATDYSNCQTIFYQVRCPANSTTASPWCTPHNMLCPAVIYSTIW